MSGSGSPPPPSGPRIDRVAAAALVLTVLGQGAVGTWKVAAADSRIDDNTRRIVALEAAVAAEADARDKQSALILASLADLRERTARIETSVSILSSQRNHR